MLQICRDAGDMKGYGSEREIWETRGTKRGTVEKGERFRGMRCLDV
jgi:hypothetical protein